MTARFCDTCLRYHSMPAYHGAPRRLDITWKEAGEIVAGAIVLGLCYLALFVWLAIGTVAS